MKEVSWTKKDSCWTCRRVSVVGLNVVTAGRLTTYQGVFTNGTDDFFYQTCRKTCCGSPVSHAIVKHRNERNKVSEFPDFIFKALRCYCSECSGVGSLSKTTGNEEKPSVRCLLWIPGNMVFDRYGEFSPKFCNLGPAEKKTLSHYFNTTRKNTTLPPINLTHDVNMKFRKWIPFGIIVTVTCDFTSQQAPISILRPHREKNHYELLRQKIACTEGWEGVLLNSHQISNSEMDVPIFTDCSARGCK